LREFSMSAIDILHTKSLVKALDLDECREIYEKSRALHTSDEIERLIKDKFEETIKETVPGYG